MSASEKKSSVQIGYVCGLALPKLDKGLQEPNTKQLSSNFKAVYWPVHLVPDSIYSHEDGIHKASICRFRLEIW